MKHLNYLRRALRVVAIAALLTGLTVEIVSAKQGATDPIPGTSKGTTNSGGAGGGGSKSSTTTTTTTTIPTPAPAPVVQPIVSGTLTFLAAGPINGVLPDCIGSYHIDPYYPTLSLLTVNVQAASVDVPDGTLLYVTVNGAGGTLYPFTSNVMPIIAGAGSCSYSVYVTPGTTISSVVITDDLGDIIFAGN